MNIFKHIIKILAGGSLLIPFLLTGSIFVTNPAFSQPTLTHVNEHDSKSRSISVTLYKSHVIQLNTSIKKVSIGNPEIADILILRAGQIYILGKDLGTTNVLLWDTSDRLVTKLDIKVTHDLDALKEDLFRLLPGESIDVHTSQRSLVMSGQVSSLTKMDAALKLAKSYGKQKSKGGGKAKGKKSGSGIINLMQVGGAQQVMLEVKVAEISRTYLKRMGIRFNAMSPQSKVTVGAVNGGASFPAALNADELVTSVFGELDGVSSPIGPAVAEFLPSVPSITDKGLFASYLGSHLMFNSVIDAAKEKGLAKILAEPTLSTLTGQEANFMSGGEFPIPVPGENGKVTIDYKNYGVALKFIPVVLNSGQINLKLNIGISELANSNSFTFGASSTGSSFFIPSLTKRNVSSTVELADGQTIGIAGLINESLRETVNKFPGLGDIPILGQLFRSQEYLKGQTELVIFVTPHLAKAIAKEDIRLPTDSFVEPTDTEFYLMGKIEGKGQKTEQPVQQGQGGFEGNFGHQITN